MFMNNPNVNYLSPLSETLHINDQDACFPGRLPQIVVVIPAYNESKHIAGVLARIPSEVASVIVVDDASDDRTVDVVRQIDDPRVTLIQHDSNHGVGAAVCSGYKRALELGADIVVKVDGDGQMDPSKIGRLISPILYHRADYTKGARFFEARALRQMPIVRLIGNLGLSFVTKLVSGYWNVMDPTNGFTAIHRQALEQLPLDTLSHGFFFETDMLVHLYYTQAVIADVQMPAYYGDEQSTLSPLKVLLAFPGKLTQAFFKRILWRYFIQDFTACSLFVVFGMLLFLSGFSFGAITWILNSMRDLITPTGTVMLAAVPLLLGFQLLLQAIVLDIQYVPKMPIHTEVGSYNGYYGTAWSLTGGIASHQGL
jgi:dolichol-phosphate mannosyltransferase